MHLPVVSNDKNANKSSHLFSSYVFNFYYIFCSFCYYTFLIPYKFVADENGYKIYSNKIRKILCFATHFWILILGMGNLRKKISIPKIIDRPNEFFVMAEAICVFFYIPVFIHMFLYKKNDLVTIMKSSLKCKDDSKSSKTNTKYRRIAILMHLSTIFSCAVHLFADTFYGHGSFTNMIGTNAAKFYYGFHLRDSSTPLDESEFSKSTIIFTLFFLVVKSWFRLLRFFTELYFYMGALSVGLIIRNFLRIISENVNLSFSKVMECYDEMKFLIDNINSVCGRIIVAVFVASIPHFARDSIAVFETTNFWQIVDYVQYAFLYLASLSFTADATNNMKQFTTCLSKFWKNEKSVTDRDKLMMLMVDIQSVRYTIGLEGYGFFTVTYTFLGSIFGILITYTLILLQLQ